LALVGSVSAAGVFVLVALYITCAVVGVRTKAIASTHGQAIDPTTALISARRTPTILANTTRTGRVASALANVEGVVPTNGCLTVDWLGERLSAIRNSNQYVPASATKIVTMSAALGILGDKYTYTTTLNGSVVNGVVNGDLYLVGGGDPILETPDYSPTQVLPSINPTNVVQLVDALVAAGVHQVTGDIVGVDNKYDQVRYVAQWPDSFHGKEAGPLGALVINDDVIVGQSVKPDDPAIGAATIIRNLLMSRGIIVNGSVRHDTLPANTPVVSSVTSAPLTDIIHEALVNSDNDTAELVLKEVGFKASGTGSTDAGLAAVKKQLADWGITSGYSQFDGSGLASENKISCDVFASLLNRYANVFPPTLAVAGVSGTLTTVFTNQSVKGRLVAKTGTLSGVKSLVGYLPVNGTDPVVFTLLMNRTGIDNQTGYRPIWYALATALDKAKAIPTPDQLAP
jgi:D-alanyl-D-alanine carboxypeptidase/D-alanyl-D-alanine-endopeptidase (penicillin-binding protein 4)